MISDSITRSGREVGDPAAGGGRDVFHEDGEGSEGSKRALCEGECSLHHAADAVDGGLHALMEQADDSGEGGTEEIQRTLDRLLQSISQFVDHSLGGTNAVLDCLSA